jgi:hypothetical protein
MIARFERMPEERRRQFSRAAGWAAFALALPLLGASMVTHAALVFVDVPVALAAGLLTAPFWSEDHFWYWLAWAQRRRWRNAGVSPWPKDATEATAWLKEYPERRDESAVYALRLSGRFEDAKQLLAELQQPTTAYQRFERRLANETIALNEGRDIDLETLNSLANAVDDPDARLLARARVAVTTAALASRGFGTWQEARFGMRQLSAELPLSFGLRLTLWGIHFPGLIAILLIFATWAVGLPLGVLHLW